jgi:hypothetical protein
LLLRKDEQYRDKRQTSADQNALYDVRDDGSRIAVGNGGTTGGGSAVGGAGGIEVASNTTASARGLSAYATATQTGGAGRKSTISSRTGSEDHKI